MIDIDILERLQIACNECFIQNKRCPDGSYPKPCPKLIFLRMDLEQKQKVIAE